MAQREFTVTELKRAGDGGYVDTPVKFTWTNKLMSAPRGSWKFGVTQRSVREDYPGVEQPVEQILGPNYKEFTLQGVWDDRYNSPGYALQTMRSFEALVQRGSLVRLEFETLSITGLLKDVNFDYQRAARIGYEFTVSPHFRNTTGLATANAGGRKDAEAFAPISDYRDKANALNDALGSSLAQAPTTNITGTTITDHKARLQQMSTAVSDLQDAVDQRLVKVGVISDTAFKKTAASLAVIKGTAAQLMTDAAVYKSSVQLGVQNAIDILNFDVWRTSASAYARQLMLTGHKGNTELTARAAPKAMALYRPHQGESLYTISQRFYGTPKQWQVIATRNGLTTMTLQGTELLIIPERKSTGGA